MSQKDSPILEVFPIHFQWPTIDPFLFCVHHLDHYPKGDGQLGPAEGLAGRELGQDFQPKNGFRMYHGRKVPGFPVHPHRGFETVTVVRTGYVDHADSLGAAGRYGGGDVQWMTAGKGIQHAEMFPLIQEKKDNPLELFQIWLNLPQSNKMVPPHFKMFWSEEIPTATSKDKKTHVTVIAGEFEKTKPPAPPPHSWAADVQNHVAIWIIEMEPHAQFDLPKAKGEVNRLLFFYEGKDLKVAGQSIPEDHGMHLNGDQISALTSADSPVKLLLLQGKPIKEPVAQYGPFVMNEEKELRQAFADFQNTQFGGWPWASQDPTHGGKLERFAKYPDGKILKPKKG